MQNKIKNIIISIGFLLIIFITFIANIIDKDKEISISERRKLAQFPTITVSEILNGNVMDKWEKYVEDQFIAREIFRGIKSLWSTKIFAQKDNNKLFEKDNAIYKMEYPLNENNVQKSAQKINEVYQKYLKNMNVYYSIIPEKNYYLENDDHLKLDYDKLQETMQQNLQELKYIDIRNGLELQDYYRTDLHWKQENLGEVVKIIQGNMKLDEMNATYEIQNKGEFYGTYYGQLSTNVTPDNISILTNETISNCIVYNYETNKKSSIYTTTNSADKYDIFLSGAVSLISIENPNSKTEKELLLFRDSFGSSLAPLLVENYKKITLIDLRYISSSILENYIDFNEQDVLFLYSSVVLNQNILK